MEIRGTVAVITGAASGIGRAMAFALADQGAGAVVIGDLNESDGEESAHMVRDRGAMAAFVRTDVTDPSAFERLFDEAKGRFGGFDILCNNAGIGEPPDGLFDEHGEPEAWEQIVRINLGAVIRGTRLGVIRLRARGRGGIIVNTASMGGLRPMPSSPVYAATKAGVVNFTRSLAYLREQANIRVNAICPSFVDTPLVWRAGPERVAMLTGQMELLAPERIAQGLVELIRDDTRAGAIMRVTSQRGIDYAREILP